MRAWSVVLLAALLAGCLAAEPSPQQGLSFNEAKLLADGVVGPSDRPVVALGYQMTEDGRGGQWSFRYHDGGHGYRREVRVENGRALLVESSTVQSNEFRGIPVYCYLPSSLDSPAIVQAAITTAHWQQEPAGMLGTISYMCVGGNAYWSVNQWVAQGSSSGRMPLYLDAQGSLLAYGGGATYTEGVGIDQVDEQISVPGSIQFQTRSAVRMALRAEPGVVPLAPAPGGPLAVLTTLTSPSGQTYEIPWDAGLAGTQPLEWITHDLAPADAAGTWTWAIPAPASASFGQVRLQVCTGQPNMVLSESSAACALLTAQ